MAGAEPLRSPARAARRRPRRLVVAACAVVIVVSVAGVLYGISSLRGPDDPLLSSRHSGSPGSWLPSVLRPEPPTEYPELAKRGPVNPIPVRHCRMFVAIISSQRYVDSEWRIAARRTWLRLLEYEQERAGGIVYRFFVGNPNVGGAVDGAGVAAVQQEQREYGDMVVLPEVPDTYQALTQKTAAVISWVARVAKRNVTFDLFVKADNDVFVHVTRTLHRLEQLAPSRGPAEDAPLAEGELPLYYGSFFWKHHKRTNKNHKNYEWVWPLPVFPPYAAGPFYVMDKQLFSILARNMQVLRHSFTNEDAAIWMSVLRTRSIDDRNVIWPKRRCFDSFVAKQVFYPSQLDEFFDIVRSHNEALCSRYKSPP